MWKKIKAANEERRSTSDQMTAILDKASTEKRDNTAEEIVLFEQLRAKSDELEKHITRLNQAAAAANIIGEQRGIPGREALGDGAGLGGLKAMAFSLEKRFSDVYPGAKPEKASERPLCVGKYIRGLAPGRWDGADAEKRAMVEGTLSAGGYLVPTPLSGTVIDVARNKARVMQAGAMTIPMSSASLKIARATADITPTWRAEGAALTATQQPFDNVVLTPKSLGDGRRDQFGALDRRRKYRQRCS
jgi:HK97 family phage major capsid protein